MKTCIGEKINNIYCVYVVALPENPEDYIRVSWVPKLCINGTFYYSDNTAENRDDYRDMMEALTPEWAKKFIPNYQEGMHLTPVYGFTDYYCGKGNAERANEKLRSKLAGLTRREFYQTKW